MTPQIKPEPQFQAARITGPTPKWYKVIENYRTGLIWNITRRSPQITTGLRRAGFQGGWL